MFGRKFQNSVKYSKKNNTGLLFAGGGAVGAAPVQTGPATAPSLPRPAPPAATRTPPPAPGPPQPPGPGQL